MKKKLFLYAALGAIILPSLSACGGDNKEVTYLRVLNSEDYIYLNDPDSGYDEPDLIHQFEDYIKEDESLSKKYGKVEVIYDTADTMENIYSEMQTGKSNYDLICASDYIVAKMVRYGLVKPIEKDLVPNYFGNDEENISKKSSNILTDRVDDILINPIQGKYKGQTQSLGDYAVGYMWGTLGFLFNPGYKTYKDQGVSEEEVIADMAIYDTVWHKYTNTIAIKDSMRDTFALGLMHAYHEQYADKEGNVYPGFDKLKEKYFGQTDDSYTAEQYNADFSKIFNYVVDPNADVDKVISDVKTELDNLKENIFGLEVDSGKQDICTGKIGINWAWSGDAVYAMDQAEDETKVGKDNIQTLYYSIPDTGSNLWMDVWVMPDLTEGKQSDRQVDLAHEFLNFLSDPSIAYKNMDYTGYTSFIAGDSILELVREWYDSRTWEITFDEDEQYTIYAVDNDILPEEVTTEILLDETVSQPLDYIDVMSFGHNSSLDSRLLYSEVLDEEEDIVIIPILIEDDEGNIFHKTYGDLTIFNNNEDYEEVDLSYFFKETLEEYEDWDMIFYSDDYTYYAVEYDNGVSETCVGRQFYAQYPDENTFYRCMSTEKFQNKGACGSISAEAGRGD